MSLNLEWKDRLAAFRDELTKHFYKPSGSVKLEGAVTFSQLTPGEAADLDFQPMPAGTVWGGKWEYGWFRGAFTLPDDIKGERIVLALDIGAESIVFVNGSAAGAKDRHHAFITLAQEGVPGSEYHILAEGYAGHGPRVAHAGPTPPDRETVPEPGPTQATVGKTTFGIWYEDVYQLWLDVETLMQLRDNLDPESLRLAEIDGALREFTYIVDFELPLDEMLVSVRDGREVLKPLLACVNGSTTPEMFGFGHSHIDVAWLWPLAETERKMGRTMSTQLALMDAYPEYKFLQSQPHLYRMLKRRYPELYQRVMDAIDRGQFIPEGATWVEPDTNISGGESLIRQFIHGKRFYREELGVDCEMLWLPDVFGYSGALPQIMRGCGVKYFSTQKIFWAYHGGASFPYNTFIWEGIDGSEVFVHLHNDYNARVDPENVIERWRERVQKDGFATRLYPFGYGDGGGGATRNHLEFARRLRDLEGAPKFRITDPIAYFKDQDARGWPDARYVGELYFQAHRGVLTSQAKTKQGNRKSEFALRRAEMWGAIAKAMAAYAFPAEELDEAWKKVLLNQFHDILPGSSIARVYEEAEAAYAEVVETADHVAEEAAGQLTQDDGGMTVFNDLPWERTTLIPLPETFTGALDEHGDPLPVQTVEGTRYAEVTVPSCGWTSIESGAAGEVTNTFTVKKDLIENAFIRVTFNEKGEITSLVDKTAQIGEFAAGPCNVFEMFKDVPTRFDAWDIDSMYENTPVSLDEPAEIEVVASGPLVGILRVTRRLHHSTLVQEISLQRGSHRLEFKTSVDWQERHKLLKVAFPVTIHANEAVHEVQFGHLARPNHRSRPFDEDRFEVANQKWTALVESERGFAVLNDCKYGVNVLHNSINLTLLKSAMAPDMEADRGLQTFTYAVYPWIGSFADSPLIIEGYRLNAPVLTVPGTAGEASLFSVSRPNVVIEAVKPAEDGSSDVIVRLYESKRTATVCTLKTALPVASAVETDMLESSVVEDLTYDDGSIDLVFRPFEIKTLRLRLA
jgi:alpha-mannosidase